METNDLSKLPWQPLYQRDGIAVKSWGEGENVVLFPGLEGNGTSCLYIAIPALEEAARHRPCRLLLVDYSREEASTLDDLTADVAAAVKSATGGAPYLSWGQSFGNLLATGLLRHYDAPVTGMLMVSPFTNLPAWMVRLGLLSLRVTPTPVYRATIPVLGRYVFGPTGTPAGDPFFRSLAGPTVRQVRKQTAWLRNADFSAYFEGVNVPAQVWLGGRDRLVDLTAQRDHFAALALRKPNYQLSMLGGSGHVVLHEPAIAQLREEIAPWLTRRPDPVFRSPQLP